MSDEAKREATRNRMRRWREKTNPASLREAKRIAARIENFWRKVHRGDECWEWIGSRDRKGYGLVSVNGRTERAHRFSWILANGSVPDGLHVLHKCDNSACVKPGHLFLGTNLDNVIDREEKGRGNQPRGERNANSRLTASDVVAIRSLRATLTQVQIAARFGTTQGTVGKILRGEAWRHVDV